MDRSPTPRQVADNQQLKTSPKGAKRDTPMTRIILSIAIVLLLCVGAHAQQPIQPGTPQQDAQPPAPGQPGDTRNRISVRTELVIVPVTVKNRDGQLVVDLQRDEFRIFSDDVEQQIVLFDSQPYPLSAVVLLDDDLAEK